MPIIANWSRPEAVPSCLIHRSAPVSPSREATNTLIWFELSVIATYTFRESATGVPSKTAVKRSRASGRGLGSGISLEDFCQSRLPSISRVLRIASRVLDPPERTLAPSLA